MDFISVMAATSNAAGMAAQEIPFGRRVERTLKLKGSCTRPTVFDHPYMANNQSRRRAHSHDIEKAGSSGME